MEKKTTTKKTTTKKKTAPEKTEQPKVEKTEPKKVTYSDIRQATDDMVTNFVKNISSVISAADSSTMTYDCNLEDVFGVPIKFFGYLTGIPRYGRMSYMLRAELRSEGIILCQYAVTITPDMDMDSNLEVFRLNCTTEVAHTLMWYLDAYPVEGKPDGDDGCECDECEMECPCRNNACCDCKDVDDDFDDEDDDEFDNAMPYDIIDGTEIYALADDILCSDADYAQHGYALLGVKNQYTVILYGKMLGNDPEHISVDIIILAVDKVTSISDRYMSTQQLYLPNILNDAAESGMSLITKLEQALRELGDEFVNGGVMETSDVNTIVDRICNDPELGDY